MRTSAVFLVVLLLIGIEVRSSTKENTESCDGFPNVDVTLAEGLCLGLVFQGKPLIKPRQIIQWDNNHFLIADMGGWVSGKGILWLFKLSDNSLKPLLTGLKIPHGLARFSANQIIIGERHQLTRLTLDETFQIINREVVVKRTDFSSHRHPLSAFKLDAKNNLIVNFGAPSDQCQLDVAQAACNERVEHAQIRRYSYQKSTDTWSSDYELLSKGLRNSMAIAIHSSGTILQAENGMDFNRVHSPFETLNQILPGSDYGWPYCHSMQKTNPYWKPHVSCTGYTRPSALLPPHAAPLDMLYYQSDKIQQLQGKLIIPFHGYQKAGYRIVAVNVDQKGVPLRAPKSFYLYSDAETDMLKKQFPAYQGASMQYLISSWKNIGNASISGILETNDGALMLLDDKNQAIYRLSVSSD